MVEVSRRALLMAGAAAAAPRVEQRVAEPIRGVEDGRQLLVDNWLVARLRGATRRLNPPAPREVALTFDAPWEGPQSGYVTVLQDGARYRMYYRGGGDQTREVTCMAESADGVRWRRPSLGMFEHDGSKRNNIVWVGRTKSYAESHNMTPFIDANPAAAPDARYKALALGRQTDPATGDRRRALVAMGSPDGLRWRRLREEPILTEGSFDSQNTAFWDTGLGRYVGYVRIGRNGVRSFARATSPDFLHWTEPVPIETGHAPVEQFYTNAVVRYARAPGLYLAFPMRFVPDRHAVGPNGEDIGPLSDGVLMSSRDGVRFDRTFLEAYLRPGPSAANWGSGHSNNTMAWGLLATTPGELSMYWTENAVAAPRLRRGTVVVDRFASVAGPYQGGEMLTPPLAFRGGALEVNAATSAVGSVRVEVRSADGGPLPGFAIADCQPIYGDETERRVAWRPAASLARVAGGPVRLRFELRDADLYAFQFVRADA